MFRILALISVLVVFTSCSAINKMMYESKCNTGDWETLGFSDGKSGSVNGNLSAWSERCSPFGKTPSKTAYMKGVNLGVTEYCKNLGYSAGQKGERSSAPGKCLGSTNANSYKTGYNSGIKEFCNYENGLNTGQSGADKPKSCHKYNSFKNGYQAGLAEHCTEKKAYDLGMTAAKSFYFKNCSTKAYSKLQRAFADGKNVAGLNSKIAALESEIKDFEAKVYDTTIPEDVKVHYRKILTQKKIALKSTERELYSKERRL